MSDAFFTSIIRKISYGFLFIASSLLSLTSCVEEQTADICIYGGTSSGVIAAYTAAKSGKTVILVEPSAHLGGLTSGGLGATDIGNKYAVTGLSRDFYRKLGKHYGKLESWTFEPHVAEALMNEYVKEKGITVLMNHRIKKAEKESTQIEFIDVIPSESFFSLSKKRISASQFIDCSYEGDLMAAAGVSYTVGREDNQQYGETYNGVQLLEKHQFPDSIDPYVVPGDPSSGLVWGIYPGPLDSTGTGDKKVQAYNYRLCLTQDTSNFIPITAPDNYDPDRYELLKRLFVQRTEKKWKHVLGSYLSIIHMPNGKTDMNNKGPFSTDYINMNWDYPEMSWRQRQKLAEEHADYIKGFLYFLGHDESVPMELREQMLSWGYAADEFKDNGGFPHQLYVREARRMIGEYVMTELNCTGKAVAPNPVGLAAYTMDSHNCQRIVVNGMVKNEGDVQIGGFPPYPVSYLSITPKREECTNLLVPVCLSASHIAYGSIRMEPVFMVLGQAAGLASCMAIDDSVPVQEVNYTTLNQTLQTNPLLDGSAPDITIDNADSSQVVAIGDWELSTRWMGQYKSNYFIRQGKKQGKHRLSFSSKAHSAGYYDGYLFIPNLTRESSTWATAVPVRVKTALSDTLLIINPTLSNYDWIHLGKFHLEKEERFSVEVVADTVSMPVVADACLWVPQKP